MSKKSYCFIVKQISAKNVSHRGSFILIGLISYLTILSLQIFIIDTIYGQTSSDGSSKIVKLEINLTVTGTSTDDKITGGTGDDKLIGGKGDDELNGKGGNNKIKREKNNIIII